MGDLLKAARRFERELKRAKDSVKPRDFEWYPHDSLSGTYQIDLLLEKDRDLLDRLRGEPMLDLGCGDGDLAFFFESLGFAVTSVDFEGTNFNRMQGVRALKNALGSSIHIHSADLDDRFEIPGGPYGLCMMLGILYHLKNPFYALECAAKRSRYCLLTTRVAERTPRGAVMGPEALGYLVNPDELAGDSTNYWIMSQEGLKRLVTRAGWDLKRYTSTGCLKGSDPVSRDRDERGCCLLQSRFV
jgi:tRNA (mo5U34)-methyltransferase